MRSLQTIESGNQFQSLRLKHPELSRFPDGASVLDYLHDKTGDLDEKDCLLGTLVEAFQSGTEGRSVAMTLLWLALWPALDGIYRRLLRHYRNNPDDLVSEISEQFTLVVHRTQLGRVHRLAATLVRNVERDIRQVLRGVWTECIGRLDLPDADALGDMLAGPPMRISCCGLPVGAGADVETTMLAALISRVVEKDADLVVAIVLFGETQNEAAARLGIGHEAARKRFQRALRRTRDGLQES